MPEAPEPTEPTTPAPPAASAPTDPPATDEPLGDAGKKALDAERARAADAEKRAKAAERELEKHRQESMTESEKAVAEAEKRGETKATERMAQRLVRADFVAAASRRNAQFDAAAVLDDLNLARLVGEDGEPDAKAIAAAVDRLVPAGAQSPSFDGGVRPNTPPAVGMSGLIRKAAGRP